MSWSAKVLGAYCERGADSSFWAEPLNAVSNAGFVAVAVIILLRVRRNVRHDARRERAVVESLALLTLLIGVGSFLFHTLATRWARMADVLPILVFMVVYLAVALRLFLKIGRAWTLALTAGFLMATLAATQLLCPATALSGASGARAACLNGTIGYVPALFALFIVGVSVGRGHPAARRLLAATGLFLISMTLRWADLELCALTSFMGRARGTHALWHLLNAATLYMLLAAVLAMMPSGSLKARS